MKGIDFIFLLVFSWTLGGSKGPRPRLCASGRRRRSTSSCRQSFPNGREVSPLWLGACPFTFGSGCEGLGGRHRAPGTSCTASRCSCSWQPVAAVGNRSTCSYRRTVAMFIVRSPGPLRHLGFKVLFRTLTGLLITTVLIPRICSQQAKSPQLAQQAKEAGDQLEKPRACKQAIAYPNL